MVVVAGGGADGGCAEGGGMAGAGLIQQLAVHSLNSPFVFYHAMIATHLGTLEFNSWVFELLAEHQWSTTGVRTLKTGFVAFVNAHYGRSLSLRLPLKTDSSKRFLSFSSLAVSPPRLST